LAPAKEALGALLGAQKESEGPGAGGAPGRPERTDSGEPGVRASLSPPPPSPRGFGPDSRSQACGRGRGGQARPGHLGVIRACSCRSPAPRGLTGARCPHAAGKLRGAGPVGRMPPRLATNSALSYPLGSCGLSIFPKAC
jgi:hypothetical protein